MLRIALAIALSAAAVSAQGLPEGPGSEILKNRCVSCHQTDLITTQRLSAAGWGRELDKMIRWGAAVEAAERDPLQSYLAANFRPRAAASHATAGEATYTRACLSCHGAEMVDQQKISRAAWVREVEKMMRWGAAVSDSEKDPLVDFLFAKTTAK